MVTVTVPGQSPKYTLHSLLDAFHENEPEFKKGLKRDCVVTPDTRLYVVWQGLSELEPPHPEAVVPVIEQKRLELTAEPFI